MSKQTLSTQKLVNCEICKELISENAPTFTISYGFGNAEPILHSMTVHKECTERMDVIILLMELFEIG